MRDPYWYRAVVVSVYDGDTVTLDIDLGLYVWLRGQKLRLYGINAPEIRGKDKERGRAARDWLRAQLSGGECMIRTLRDRTEKYGRWLCKIYVQGRNLNHEMVELGLAEPYMATDGESDES